MPILIDWGARSEKLRALHARQAGATKNFLLAGAPTPAALGALTASQVPAWDTATTTPIPVTANRGTFTASATLPAGTDYVRMDFEVRGTIDSVTDSCLEFRQLFYVSGMDTLMPVQFSFRDHLFNAATTAGSPPTAAPAPPRRIVLGTCPLVKATPGGVTVNCEFLDVTDFWWRNWAAKDQWGWLLNPAFHGRPELIRVLMWTSGCAPMLWFVALTPTALEGTVFGKRNGADMVFFRAQAGFNSFRYTADEKGFLNPRHADTTMFHLGRWLLDTLPEPETAALVAKDTGRGRPWAPHFAGIRIRPRVMPQPAATPPVMIAPADPIDRVNDDVRWAFHPAGVHNTLIRGGYPDVAFLPLGFDGGGAEDPYTSGGGYTALIKPNALREVVASARDLLWMRGSLEHRILTQPVLDREIWLVGNSAANRQVFACLAGNAADVDRVVSLDATPAKENLTPLGVPAITAAADARGKAGKKFKAVVVTTPNLWKDKTDYLGVEASLLATKADVTMLPPTAEFDTYWLHPPTAASNPMMFEALGFWDGFGLEKSRRLGSGGGVQWLWWHEWSVHGGHLAPSSAAAGAPLRVRTFFEDAVGL